MSNPINDLLNIQFLKLACAGEGVEINVSEISNLLNRHRNTINSRLKKLIRYELIDSPFLPFRLLLKELPLLVIEKIALPRDQKTNLWIELDPKIWAAFFFRDEEYNTLLIELHKDLYDYQVWKEHIISENKITINPGMDYIPSESFYFSTRAIMKYEPSAPIKVFRENFEKGFHPRINGLTLDDICIDLLELVLQGKGININANYLGRTLHVHRKTIQKRFEHLSNTRIILPPVCRFPRMWTPPEYFLVITFFEIKKNKLRAVKALIEDPHISTLIKANVGRYNYIAFSSFYRVEDHLAWEEDYSQRIIGAIGAVKNLYLSPAMTFAIHQQYVSLTFLENKLEELKGREFMASMNKKSNRTSSP